MSRLRLARNGNRPVRPPAMLVVMTLCCCSRIAAATPKPDVTELIPVVVPAAVRVVVSGGSTGSGVIVDLPGESGIFALTAFHVIRNGRIRQVDWFDLAHYPQPAHAFLDVQVVAASKDLDLALLQLSSGPGPKISRLQLSAVKTQPETVFSVGCTNGAKPTLLSERLLDKVRVTRPKVEGSRLMWRTENAPSPGRSGGPLVNKECRLLGIAVAGGKSRGDGPTRGFYCHVTEIESFLKQRQPRAPIGGGANGAEK